MASSKNNLMKAFTEMKESLHEAVFNSVGKQLIEESKLNQQSLNEQLIEKIHEFAENVSKTAKELIETQFESKIREIVKEEIKLH